MTKEQWIAIRDRDASWDGKFYYALRSAKSVCRPSCPVRHPTPKNVRVFDTLEQAIALGYHPCSRCRPDLERWEGAKAELARAAERYIREHCAEGFSLEALANALHNDKSYLLRTFKAETGETPLRYHNRIRCEAAQELLTRPELSISYIASAVGYASSSHFTQVFRRMTGKTPSQYRDDYLKGLDD